MSELAMRTANGPIVIQIIFLIVCLIGIKLALNRLVYGHWKESTWRASLSPLSSHYRPLPIRFMPYIKLSIEFKLQDAWIGVFWRAGHVWICLIPCFPLHIKFTRNAKIDECSPSFDNQYHGNEIGDLEMKNDKSDEPTETAMRTAKMIGECFQGTEPISQVFIDEIAQIIDRQTGVMELVEALKKIIVKVHGHRPERGREFRMGFDEIKTIALTELTKHEAK